MGHTQTKSTQTQTSRGGYVLGVSDFLTLNLLLLVLSSKWKRVFLQYHPIILSYKNKGESVRLTHIHVVVFDRDKNKPVTNNNVRIGSVLRAGMIRRENFL